MEPVGPVASSSARTTVSPTSRVPSSVSGDSAGQRGAVANALDRLTALGQAQLTSEKPRRYQAAQTPPAPAGTT